MALGGGERRPDAHKEGVESFTPDAFKEFVSMHTNHGPTETATQPNGESRRVIGLVEDETADITDDDIRSQIATARIRLIGHLFAGFEEEVFEDVRLVIWGQPSALKEWVLRMVRADASLREACGFGDPTSETTDADLIDDD